MNTNKLNELMYAWLPETAFLAFSIRLIVLGASVGDSISLLVIAALISYKKWMAKSALGDYETLKEEIATLRDSINGLKVDKAFSQQSKKTQVAPSDDKQEKKQRLFF